MVTRRGAMAIGAVAVMLSATVAAQEQNRKLSDEQKREIQATVKIVDDAMAGRPAPNDLSLAWVRHDVMKGPASKQYVPFVVAVDPAKVSGGNVTVYWRVVAKPDPSAAAAPAATGSNAKPAQAPVYAYEDLNTAAVTGKGGPAQIGRAFVVPPGSYDVHVVVKEPTSTKRNAPAAKVSFLTHTIEVPNFWNDELSTSSVIVAQRIDPLPAPLTPQQQAERPYAIGMMEVVPEPDTVFSKQDKLSTYLLIYNAKTDGQNKPDITVDFSFYAKQGGSEKFFNKTKPESWNAQTLPPEFDAAAGHQLPSGQDVPLASFPEGDYRLEIKVTDKLANKSITRDVNFTVTGS